jgi:hypothetical protein
VLGTVTELRGYGLEAIAARIVASIVSTFAGAREGRAHERVTAEHTLDLEELIG